MNFIYNLNLRSKLMLLVSFPLIGLLVFATLQSFDTYKDYKSMERIEKVSITLSLLSNFIHETDIERTMTSIFIGSEGDEFKDVLSKQRKISDSSYIKLTSFMKSSNMNIYTKIFTKNIFKAMADFKTVRSNRNSVDVLNISLEKALTGYTNINSLIINEIVKISKISSDLLVTQNLISYGNFLLFKETTGIERGVGANAIVKDKFEFGIKERWQQLITQSELYLRLFNANATVNEQNYYKNIINKDIMAGIIELRKTAIYSGMTSDFGIDVSDWYDVKILQTNALLKIEKKLINDMFKNIKNKKKQNLQKTIFISLLSLFILVFTLVISFIIISSLLSSFNIFKKGLLGFLSYAVRQTNIAHAIEVRGSDEFAFMTKEINSQIELIKHTIEEDKLAVEEIDNIMGKIANGFYGYKIINLGSSNEVKRLINSINVMTLDAKNKFDTINKILDNYGLGNFEYKPKETELKGMYGDFGSLLHSSRLLGRNISELLAQLSNAGNALEKNTSVLSDSSKQLAQASNQQAGSLEETAASIDEITTNIKNTSQNVKEMANIADDVTSSAMKGEKLATKTTESMNEINSKIDEINNAITVIDQIAFQTNILSLNAAVEAATAGEAGKGFAVVAQEVRNLASRSADSANEIKSLVESANITANNGKKVATEMKAGYNNLNEKITRNKEMIDEVLHATQDQEKGMIQINTAVSLLDQVTQNNASESARISELIQEVSHLSDQLIRTSANSTIEESTKKAVCNVELTNLLAERKHDHIVFMDVNFSKLGNFERWDVVDSKSCKLGKWIAQCELENIDYTTTPNWEKLKSAHDGVHNSMQNYINKNANRETNFELKLAAEDLNVNMEKVFTYIDQIKVDSCELIAQQKLLENK